MKKRFFNCRAFSLAEAVIFIIVLGVVVGASTQFLTRKRMNILDFGGTLGGGNHGRFEVYNQEIIGNPEKEDEPYRKILKEEPEENYITIYQKLTDAEYQYVIEKEPKIDKSNKPYKKSTIYIEITKVNPIKNPDGSITKAKDASGKEYLKGEKYIFEDTNVTYQKCSKKTGNKKTEYDCPKNPKDNLIDSDARIIEGNYTKKCKGTCKNALKDINGTDIGKPSENYFLIQAEGSDLKNFDLPREDIPWVRKYIGNNKIPSIDGPIVNGDSTDDSQQPSQPSTEPVEPSEISVSLKIPDNVKGITFHAVGGGGAGMQIGDSNLSEPITPNKLNPQQEKIIKKRLKEALKQAVLRKNKEGKLTEFQIEYINKKLCTLTSGCNDIKDDAIVIGNYGDLGTTNLGKISVHNNPGNKLENEFKKDTTWIVVNTNDGTITVKADLRYGLVYPHELLKYTEHLGTPVQKPVIYDMPEWFNIEKIEKGGFPLGAYVCSGKGGKGADYTLKSKEVDHSALKSLCYCGNYQYYKKNETTCTPSGICEPSNNHTCVSTVYYYRTDGDTRKGRNDASRIYDCNDYSDCDTYNGCNCDGCNSPKNPSICNRRNKNTRYDQTNVNYKYLGGAGGSGVCGYLAVNASEKSAIKVECGSFDNYTGSDGSDGGTAEVKPSTVTNANLGSNFDITNACAQGSDGTSCNVKASSSDKTVTMEASGGKKGNPCVQQKHDQVVFDEKGNPTSVASTTWWGFGDRQSIPSETRRIEPGKTATIYSNSCSSGSVEVGKWVTTKNGGKEWKTIKSDADYNVVAPDSTNSLEKLAEKSHKNNHFIMINKEWLDNITSGCSNEQKGCRDNVNGDDGELKYDDKVLPSDTGTADLPEPFKGGECKKGVTPACDNSKVPGIGTDPGVYNHIYLWTTPYAIDALAYGESGQAGQYVTKSINEIKGSLEITLGKGGKPGVDNGNGTATIIREVPDQEALLHNPRKLLEAAGGKGGSTTGKTDAFDMCFMGWYNGVDEKGNSYKGEKDQTPLYYCKNPDKNDTSKGEGVFCCNGNRATKSTKDLQDTSIKYSKFEDIASSVNNSNIIGIGLGRGAEGYGSGTFNEELKGSRNGVNASTYAGYINNKKIIVNEGSPSSGDGNVENQILTPSQINAMGGGGAVIIIW